MARTTTKVSFEITVDASFIVGRPFVDDLRPPIRHVYYFDTCDNKPESCHNNGNDYCRDWLTGDRLYLSAFLYSRAVENHQYEEGQKWNTPRNSERGPKIQSILITRDPILINHVRVVRAKLYAEWEIFPSVAAALAVIALYPLSKQ